MSRTEYETSNIRFEKCTKYSTGCMFIVGPSAMLELTLSRQNNARRLAPAILTRRTVLLQRAGEQVLHRIPADLADRIEHRRRELRGRFGRDAQLRERGVEPRRVRQRSRHRAELLRRIEILLRSGHHLRD